MNVIKKVFFIALMIWALWMASCMAATGTINAEGARIRREPNTTSDVLTIAYSGETVEILEKQGQWYKVKYGDSEGYIREDLMQVSGEVEENANLEEVVPAQAEPENETVEEPEKEIEEKLNEEIEYKPEEVLQGEQPQEFVEVEKSLRIDTVAKIIPSLSASKLADLKQGEKVVVTQEMNKWSCVRINEKTAWVLTANLEDVDNSVEVYTNTETTNSQPEVETKTMYISVSAAVLRSGPDTSYDPILEMYRGKSVEILAEEGDWYKVKYGEQEGYVAKRLVVDKIEEANRSMLTERRENTTLDTSVTEEETIQEAEAEYQEQKVEEQVTDTQAISLSKGEEVVAYAKQFLGCKYVYGGSGPSSFDCSGFTQYVYGQFGISLLHSAVTQSNNGTYVQKANLQLGDLVIFRDWDNSGIGHCGIYIGDGNFIHAANSTRGVVIDTLNSGYYYERYVSARRLF